MRALLLAGVLSLICHAAAAEPVPTPPAADADSCLPGIVAAEQRFAVPPKLLHTIGLVESGRADPVTGHVAPWPWTINVAGIDHVFPTKAAAIEAVQDLQNQGTRSIDVGCMQINLMHHPNAFASLDEAFDPAANTQYGARFLSALYREIGNWPQAAAAYHSRTQDIGASYETRVMAIWPLAARFPDASLQQRAQPAAPVEDTSQYTPQFAIRVKQMHADAVRLAANASPVARPLRLQPITAAVDYSRFTPEFAARLKETARDRARHAQLAAANTPPDRPARPGPASAHLPVRLVDSR